MKALLQNLRTYGAPLLLCVVVAIALIAWWHATHSVSASRALAAFSVAGIVILLAHGAFFPATANESRAADDPTVVRRAIAYDSVVFTITGFAAAVAATPLWQTTLLLGGACLLIGAFFGLLFGYPQGVAQAGGKPGPSGQLDPAAQPSAPQRNLIAESASTLGKVIAGFTLAKVGSLVQQFQRLCDVVAPALGPQGPSGNTVLAGAIIVYFFSVGFFSGLLLPTYFMSGKFGS